jgi:polyhydroxybutyrate depolymerase
MINHVTFLKSFLLTCLLLSFLAPLLHAKVFPHIFRLDDNNNSTIYVQNLSDSGTNDVRVSYIGQDGMNAGGEMTMVPPSGSARFMNPPMGFTGVAEVTCSLDCAITGTWNFGLQGQGNFAVGISPMDPSISSASWAAPIPALGENSGFGIAVQNVGSSPTSCSVFYYTPDGEELSFRDGFPPNQGIPVGGQFAFLSSNMPANVPPADLGPDGFEGSVILTCFEPVIPVVINQDQINGFPTPISMEMRQVPPLASGDYSFTLAHDGEIREYELHVPPGYDGSAVPLVVDFHGWGVNSTLQSNFSGFRQQSDQEGFLVAWPQGLGDLPSWNAGGCCGFASQNDIDDVGFAKALVADVAERTAIDQNRVYATGQSNGGAITQRLGCEAADVFAGIAPVAFPLPTGLVADCQPDRPIPVVHFHGIDDLNVPYQGNLLLPGAVESHDAWASINECTDNEPVRILTQGNSYCDAYMSCADGVINVLCTVDAGHATYPNPDINVPDVAWDLLSPYALP